MKRLILLLWMMLGASAFGINITNYPATNAFDGSMTFLLSKASAFTNFNIQADLIASTNWSIATFDPSGSASAATNGYPWTNIVVQEAVHATNADTLGGVWTNGHDGVATSSLKAIDSEAEAGILTFRKTDGMWSVANDETFSAGFLLGNGAGVTQLDATNLTSGTVANARLPVNVVTNGNVGAVTFSNAPLTVSKTSPSANEVLFNILTSDDASRFSVDEDGDVFMDGSLDLPGSIKRSGVTFIATSSAGGGSITIGAGNTYGSTLNLQATSVVAVNTNLTVSGTLTATNGVNLMVKPSFTTNFTCTTNLQTYLCNGTNQVVTLPNAAYVPNVIYRFTSTNGYGSYTLTNATGAQTIRDGTSLSHKQIGVAPIALFSDGANWWLAAKDQEVNPNAQFSCSTNIPLTLANTAYPVTFDTIDFNNSQGIALALGTNGTHFSKMWITNSGQYEFSPSVVQTFNGNDTIRFWFRSNDTNIPASCTPSRGQNGSIRVITVPFIVNVTTPTAYEIWAESDSTGEEILAQAASGNYPSAPSIICPIKRISDIWP